MHVGGGACRICKSWPCIDERFCQGRVNTCRMCAWGAGATSAFGRHQLCQALFDEYLSCLLLLVTGLFPECNKSGNITCGSMHAEPGQWLVHYRLFPSITTLTWLQCFIFALSR